MDPEFAEYLATGFMNAMVPGELVEVVAGSRGYILDKGGGAPRAVCCVWAIRRFAGKIELAQNGKEYASDLEIVSQYGVGVPGGVGFVYQANMLGIRAAMDQSSWVCTLIVKANLLMFSFRLGTHNCLKKLRQWMWLLLTLGLKQLWLLVPISVL